MIGYGAVAKLISVCTNVSSANNSCSNTCLAFEWAKLATFWCLEGRAMTLSGFRLFPVTYWRKRVRFTVPSDEDDGCPSDRDRFIVITRVCFIPI